MSEKEFLEKDLGLKYDLVPLSPEPNKSEYFMLLALRDFGDVKANDTGGIISKNVVLSHDGNCWVYNDAVVDGDVVILGDTTIKGDTFIKSKNRLTIFNSQIEDSIIKLKSKTDIEYCKITNGEINKKKDFTCLDPDESMTAYVGRNGQLLLITDGSEIPMELQLGLCMVNYSNRFDKILKDAITFKNKHVKVNLKRIVFKRNKHEVTT